MSDIFSKKAFVFLLMSLFCSPFASPSCGFCANNDDGPHPVFSLALTSAAQQDSPDAPTPASQRGAGPGAPPPFGQRVS